MESRTAHGLLNRERDRAGRLGVVRVLPRIDRATKRGDVLADHRDRRLCREAREVFAVRGLVRWGRPYVTHPHILRLADFTTAPDHGDVAIIDGVTYTVFEVLADAMGGVTLSMRAAA